VIGRYRRDSVDNSVLGANLTITPGTALLDPVTHDLKEDLVSGHIRGDAASDWSKGVHADVFRVSLTLDGDVAAWPFDRFRSGPLSVEFFPALRAFRNGDVTLVDRLLGWNVAATRAGKADAPAPYRLDCIDRRAPLVRCVDSSPS